MPAEPPLLKGTEWWSKLFAACLDAYRTDRLNRGLKRPLLFEGYCSGMASEFLGLKVPRD